MCERGVGGLCIHKKGLESMKSHCFYCVSKVGSGKTQTEHAVLSLQKLRHYTTQCFYCMYRVHNSAVTMYPHLCTCLSLQFQNCRPQSDHCSYKNKCIQSYPQYSMLCYPLFSLVLAPVPDKNDNAKRTSSCKNCHNCHNNPSNSSSSIVRILH